MCVWECVCVHVPAQPFRSISVIIQNVLLIHPFVLLLICKHFIAGLRFIPDLRYDGTSVCMSQTHFHNIYFRNQFQEMNDSLVRSCTTDVEAFLKDIDRSVAMSHDLLGRFDKSVCVSEMEDKDWLEAQEKVCFDNGTAPSPTHADVD